MNSRLRLYTRWIAGVILLSVSFLGCCTLPVHGQSPLLSLTSPELWKPGHVPFSFTYGGKLSTQFLSSWVTRVESSPGGSSHVSRYIYVDPITKLRVTAEVRLYPDFPEVVDWVLRFNNEGAGDTPILENILPLDWSMAASTGVYTLHHARGSDGKAEDFEPLEEAMQKGDKDHLESSLGLSSSLNTLPYFNLQTDQRGLIGAVGWTGDWKADFAYAKDGRSIAMSSGMKRTHLLLRAGEEIRTPRMVLMNWSGGTWMDAQNRWRRFLLTHYSPQENGKPMVGPVIFGSWGSEAIADKIAKVRWAHEHGLPLSVYAVDAGWYGASVGAESDPTNPEWNPWYKNRGDWFPSPRYYPNGIKPLGEELKKDGFGFSLWIEPETAMLGTKLVRDHPTWYLHRPVVAGANPFPWADFHAVMLNLGNAEARRGITDLVSDAISEYGMTWYRQDFNIPPSVYWQQADSAERIGMTEIKHITGLYQMWDELLARHPGLHIDNCASGGRRLDIEMMSRSFVVWRTDHGTDPLAVQAQTAGLAPWVPLSAAIETYTNSSPWTKGGPYSTAESLYLVRLAYSAGFGLSPGGHGPDDDRWVAWVKQVAAEYREVQPYFYGDFYPMVPYSLAEESWSGWQWDRPNNKDGLIVLLRRPKSPFSAITLDVQHVDAKATYAVEVRSGLMKAETKRMTGGELAHLQMQLPAAPDSLMILYREE